MKVVQGCGWPSNQLCVWALHLMKFSHKCPEAAERKTPSIVLLIPQDNCVTHITWEKELVT